MNDLCATACVSNRLLLTHCLRLLPPSANDALASHAHTHTHTEVGEKRADNNSAWKANAGEGGGGEANSLSVFVLIFLLLLSGRRDGTYRSILNVISAYMHT